MSVEKGLNNFDYVISKFDGYNRSNTIIIESVYGFLNVTRVVQSIRNSNDGLILWGINEKHYKDFAIYSDIVGVVIFPLPEIPLEDIKTWDKSLSNKGFRFLSLSNFAKSPKEIPNPTNVDIKNFYFPSSLLDMKTTGDYLSRNNLIPGRYSVIDSNIKLKPKQLELLINGINGPVVLFGSINHKFKKAIYHQNSSLAKMKLIIKNAKCAISGSDIFSNMCSCVDVKTKLIEFQHKYAIFGSIFIQNSISELISSVNK